MNDFVKAHKCTYILEKVIRESDVKSYGNDSSDEVDAIITEQEENELYSEIERKFLEWFGCDEEN